MPNWIVDIAMALAILVLSYSVGLEVKKLFKPDIQNVSK